MVCSGIGSIVFLRIFRICYTKLTAAMGYNVLLSLKQAHFTGKTPDLQVGYIFTMCPAAVGWENYQGVLPVRLLFSAATSSVLLQ